MQCQVSSSQQPQNGWLACETDTRWLGDRQTSRQGVAVPGPEQHPALEAARGRLDRTRPIQAFEGHTRVAALRKLKEMTDKETSRCGIKKSGQTGPSVGLSGRRARSCADVRASPPLAVRFLWSCAPRRSSMMRTSRPKVAPLLLLLLIIIIGRSTSSITTPPQVWGPTITRPFPPWWPLY